jgi:hypothetical protein
LPKNIKYRHGKSRTALLLIAAFEIWASEYVLIRRIPILLLNNVKRQYLEYPYC